MDRYDDVLSTLAAMAPDWTGADWTHEYGDSAYCYGGTYADCATCASAEEDAREAAAEYEALLDALRRGDLCDAIVYAQAAADREAEYGDAAVYGPVVRLLRRVASE